jgi:quinolinate synthase
MTTAEIATLHEEVRALAAEREAVILRTTTRCPRCRTWPISSATRWACPGKRGHDAEAIVFCGVHFMAETASILAPDKTVLIPDLDAGCSLAASITADQLRAWKAGASRARSSSRT